MKGAEKSESALCVCVCLSVSLCVCVSHPSVSSFPTVVASQKTPLHVSGAPRAPHRCSQTGSSLSIPDSASSPSRTDQGTSGRDRQRERERKRSRERERESIALTCCTAIRSWATTSSLSAAMCSPATLSKTLIHRANISCCLPTVQTKRERDPY